MEDYINVNEYVEQYSLSEQYEMGEYNGDFDNMGILEKNNKIYQVYQKVYKNKDYMKINWNVNINK